MRATVTKDTVHHNFGPCAHLKLSAQNNLAGSTELKVKNTNGNSYEYEICTQYSIWEGVNEAKCCCPGKKSRKEGVFNKAVARGDRLGFLYAQTCFSFVLVPA